MMDLATIRAMNKSAAWHASRAHKQPWEPTSEQRQALKDGASLKEVHANIPLLGDYVPKGWKLTGDDDLFCGKSGCGSESEPALTGRALALVIGNDPDGTAYGAGDEGQFQIYLHRYVRKPVRGKHPALAAPYGVQAFDLETTAPADLYQAIKDAVE